MNCPECGAPWYSLYRWSDGRLQCLAKGCGWEGKAADLASEGREQPEEDRGTPVHVWRVRLGSVGDGTRVSFVPLYHNDTTEYHVLSVPIGWRLATHHAWGVVLENAFGERLTARQALERAEAHVGGWRARCVVAPTRPAPTASLRGTV
jgi:hypothetical protein